MKKLFTILALGAGFICANAQSVKGNKFADNWTLGISGGVITPTTNHAFSIATATALMLSLAACVLQLPLRLLSGSLRFTRLLFKDKRASTTIKSVP